MAARRTRNRENRPSGRTAFPSISRKNTVIGRLKEKSKVEPVCQSHFPGKMRLETHVYLESLIQPTYNRIFCCETQAKAKERGPEWGRVLRQAAKNRRREHVRPPPHQTAYNLPRYFSKAGLKPIWSGAWLGICGKASCPGKLFASMNSGPSSVMATSQPM